MRRREFVGIVGGAALVGPIAALAQQRAGIPRIGVLTGSSPSVEAAGLAAFRGALEKLGYIDGQTVLIEPRYAEGRSDRFDSLARELVALAPSVIACVGRRETTALQTVTRTIPIVFMQVGDPVEQGFVATLAGRAAIPPGSPRCRPSSIRNGWSYCTGWRRRCRARAFWSTPTSRRVSGNGSTARSRPPRAWASPCTVPTPPPRPN